MDCGHDVSGMMACSMSCCQDAVRPAIMPVAFVLPQVMNVPTVDEVISPVSLSSSFEISQVTEPLSPPPRLATAVR